MQQTCYFLPWCCNNVHCFTVSLNLAQSDTPFEETYINVYSLIWEVLIPELCVCVCTRSACGSAWKDRKGLQRSSNDNHRAESIHHIG